MTKSQETLRCSECLQKTERDDLLLSSLLKNIAENIEHCSKYNQRTRLGSLSLLFKKLQTGKIDLEVAQGQYKEIMGFKKYEKKT